MPRPVRRHFLALAKVPIRVWQTQFWTKKIVEAQIGPASETRAWTLRPEGQLAFSRRCGFRNINPTPASLTQQTKTMNAWKQLARVPGPRGATALAGSSIYVVDDTEGLAELYTLFLKGTGCNVRTYDNRAEALAALASDRTRPDLLIMDYLGDSMPVDRFLQRCLAVHPFLRILMASELSPGDVMSLCVKPDRSIQKPFTADEFVREVRAALSNE
jgi:CheY-like chemotaxis protein